MPQSASLARLAKAIGANLQAGEIRGAMSTLAALDANEIGIEELLNALIAEGERKRSRDDYVTGYIHVLSYTLCELRVSSNGGDMTASRSLEHALHAIDAAASKGVIDPGILMLISRACAQAGVGPSSRLQDAMVAAMERLDATQGRPLPAVDQFSGLVAQFNHDPFTIYDELANSATAFPPAYRQSMIASLAHSDVASVRKAAMGFVLAPEDEVAIFAAHALADQTGNLSDAANDVRRLVLLRPWVAECRRPAIDAAIKSLRPSIKPGDAPAPATIGKLLSSPNDGTGATTILAVVKRQRGFDFCSVMIKSAQGVADAFVRRQMPRREIDSVLAHIESEVNAQDVSREYVQRVLMHALAVNLKSAAPPPFALIDVLETMSLGPIYPQYTSTQDLVAGLLQDLQSTQTDERAARKAHVASRQWPHRINHLDSWFEAGEEIERLLKPIKSRPQQIKVLLENYLPTRREFWAAQCAWAAALLKESTDADDATNSDWLHFALVARDLAGGTPLSAIPFMTQIAEATTFCHATIQGR